MHINDSAYFFLETWKCYILNMEWNLATFALHLLARNQEIAWDTCYRHKVFLSEPGGPPSLCPEMLRYHRVACYHIKQCYINMACKSSNIACFALLAVCSILIRNISYELQPIHLFRIDRLTPSCSVQAQTWKFDHFHPTEDVFSTQNPANSTVRHLFSCVEEEKESLGWVSAWYLPA